MSGSARLIGRTAPLGPAFDLLANYQPDAGFFFERNGSGISGLGTTGGIGVSGGRDRIHRLARAAEVALNGIRCEGEGPPPVAIGAIPFHHLEPASLAIPARTVRRDGGGGERQTWQIDVWAEGLVPEDHHRERWTGRSEPHEAFRDIQLRPEPVASDYVEAVGRARDQVRRGELRKVVLARSLIVHADRELDPKQLLWRLRAVDPDCYVFGAPTYARRGDELLRMGTLVGASPELLVARSGRDVRANPLAGSAPRLGDPDADRAFGERLLASAKDREEHAVVVDAVAEALRPLCEYLEGPPEPQLLATANVWHLSTPFHGRLRDPALTAMDVVAALHPTPAVCGAPPETALGTIGRLEPFDRRCYAGPIGWVDANGDGEWAIALRCAELAGSVARLFAGAGIVADSQPEQELDETEQKFRAFLDSLRWG